jgi:cell envelope-related function transcriptional attenuator common domain
MRKKVYGIRDANIQKLIWKSGRSKKAGKSPEQKLFHRPITPRKIIVYALLALLFAGLVLAGRFVYVAAIHPSAAFNWNYGQNSAPSNPGGTPGKNVSAEEQLASQADLSFMKERVNILLVGIDSTEERASEGRKDFRTDTIMMMCVDFDTGQVDVLSIPRDSYADIAWTTDRWKINGAFMSAGGREGDGFGCLMETVSMTLGGIPVHYYVAVEMQGLKDIIDTMGGVWYDVKYEFELDGVHLLPGYQLLDGEESLQYCRERKDITSGLDIDRIDRQQQFVIEVFRQLKENAQITNIPKMYNAVSDEIYTNLNLEQIAALSLFMLDLDPDTELSRYALTGKYMWVYNANYYVLDHTYTEQVLHEIFGDDADLDIDWDYSIEYVENVAAKQKLENAIDALQKYLDNDGDLRKLRKAYPDWDDLDSLVSKAKSMLSSAKKKLGGSTGAMKNAARDLEDMLESLRDFVADADAPTTTPTPTPSETSSAEPSEPTASSEPSASATTTPPPGP